MTRADIAGVLADEVPAVEADYWTDGRVRIPRSSSPMRAGYDRCFVALCEETFLRPGQRFTQVEVPTAEHIILHANGVRNFDRFELYLAIFRAGEPVPPIVVERVNERWYIIDGNHRTFAARRAGVEHLAGLAREAHGVGGRTP